MQIHDLVQGTDAWHQFRLDHFGASEAAAMLGLSKKVTRTELLGMKHTGLAKEFSDWVQENILDYGHKVEALARPIVEGNIGDDLYPVTCSDGRISASCDGLVVSETHGWEHKQWNATLAAAVASNELPDEFMVQPQQCLMVTGAERWTFTVSDGTAKNMVSMEILPDPAWFERIRAGWAQFEKDLAGYVPIEIVEKPKAEAIMQLPALAIQIRGDVVSSNLPAFKSAATQFIANIKTDLQTDEDFVQAEATVKFCEKAEKDLELTKSAAIAQTASIDELMRTIDHIQAQLRDKRLTLDKLVKSQKEVIKSSILSAVKLAFTEHVASLDAEIKPIRMVFNQPDFAGAMKNKRTLANLHDAVDSELATAKIDTDTIAKDVRAKLAWVTENANDYRFLLSDLQAIIYRGDSEYFQLIIQNRIDDHKEKESAKLEAERARIQKEEEAKATAKAAEETRRQVAEAQAKAALSSSAPQAETEPGHAPQARPFPTHAAPSATATAPTLTLGKIGARLGFSLTADFLRSIGFEPAARERSAVLYREESWQAICTALIEHIGRVREPQQQAA